jgi:SET domain-containing protein
MPSPVRRASSRLKVGSSGVHGRGVYAAKLISKGTRIIEYAGERTSWEDTSDDEDDPHTFIFGLGSGEVINAGSGGNEARWINHCCEPNCEAFEEEGRVFIYAKRKIEPGEELSFDYALEIDEPITEKQKKEFECLCGSASCRRTMLAL